VHIDIGEITTTTSHHAVMSSHCHLVTSKHCTHLRVGTQNSTTIYVNTFFCPYCKYME